MNNNEYIFRTVHEILDRTSPLVLASIISQQGSSPRHIGARMVIGIDGNYGTIGGSLLEANVIKESRKVLTSGQSRLMDFDLTSENVNSAGMICGGKATVMLDYVSATQENLALFQNAYQAIAHGEDFTLLTFFKSIDHSFTVIARCLRFKDGKIIGNCPVSGSELEDLIRTASETRATSVVPVRDMRVLVEPVRKIKTLYCFGAGHVARPTAQIAALVGFRVVVIDDRAEFSNVERFPDAWDVRVIDDFNHAFDNLDVDPDSFLVIFTRGHLYDREVLEQALKTSAGYIGMIGSRRKVAAIYNALMEKGVTEQELKRVHSPIGIPIGGETPEEIAVSIVAELINVRASSQG